MNAWQVLSVCGVAFIILEIFTPSMFFLNFALASFLTAIVSLYVKNIYFLAIIFVLLSFASFIFLRPLIIKRKNKSQETGIEGKYIGQVVQAQSEITSSSGLISIYGERWEARVDGEEVIPQGANVKIIRCENIIMYVEKI